MSESSESVYAMIGPVDSDLLATFFDADSHLVKEFEFREAIFRNGVKKQLRDQVWRFLFQFYPFNSTKNERMAKYKEKYVEYFIMKYRWQHIVKTLDQYSDQSNWDQVFVPQIPFGLNIDMNQDLIRPNEPTSSEFEPSDLEGISVEYIKLQTIVKVSRTRVSNQKLVEDIRQIDKDVERTCLLIDMRHNSKISQSDLDRMSESLRNILVTFATFNQKIDDNFDLGYAQGMNELASIFLEVFNEESVAYWCFSNFMLLDTYSTSSMTFNTNQISSSHILKVNAAFYFSSSGVVRKLKHLSVLINKVDPEFYEYLSQLGYENCFFCHEWLLVCFRRCFKSQQNYMHCFELLQSRFLEFHFSALKNIRPTFLYSFDLFICLALLEQVKKQMIEKTGGKLRDVSETEFHDLLKELNKSAYFESHFHIILDRAESMFNQYCMKASEAEEEKPDDDDDVNQGNLMLWLNRKMKDLTSSR